MIHGRKRSVWSMSRDMLTGKKILEQNCGIACTALKLDLSTTGFVPPFKRVEISSHKFRRAYAKPLFVFLAASYENLFGFTVTRLRSTCLRTNRCNKLRISISLLFIIFIISIYIYFNYYIFILNICNIYN